MRILRIRPGFQADHSSSSYLFYAVDGPVSAEGQRLAHRFSSRAEVEKRSVWYQKWGESSLSDSAFPALLGEHYDVMASESYDSWHLMIAVPKTPQMEELLQPFHDWDDGEYNRLDIHDYGKRLAIDVYCDFDEEQEDSFEDLVRLLAKIRSEILQGDVSFLQAVVDFYGTGEEDEEDEGEEDAAAAPSPPAHWTKAELQQECIRRGITFAKSWTKDQLREALASPAAAPKAQPRPAGGKPPKLSAAARRIVRHLDRR